MLKSTARMLQNASTTEVNHSATPNLYTRAETEPDNHPVADILS